MHQSIEKLSALLEREKKFKETPCILPQDQNANSRFLGMSYEVFSMSHVASGIYNRT
jgi:hypothetical protein